MLLAVALSLVLAVLLSACEDASQSEEPTGTANQPTPTATEAPVASPTPSPQPTPTATPPFIMPDPDPRFAIRGGTPEPTATSTPEPSRSPLIEYAQQCGLLIFQLDSGQIVDDPALYTWHVLAQDIDQLVDDYGRLVPPPELAEYHTANLDAWTSLRDAAQEHPSEDSFTNDFERLFEELADELLRVGSTPATTDEERELLFEEILVEKLRDFYGQDTYAADQTAQEALKALPEEAREVLEGTECVPPLFVVDAETDDIERAALVAIYNATDGPNWVDNTNWLSDAPIGEWYGVTTENGRVIALDLDSNQLNGEIPPELGNLSALYNLSLSANQLSGEIPPELGDLSFLEVLAAYDNQLSGEIPSELGNLAYLSILRLSLNQLSGEIPPELGNLSSLRELSLLENQLSGEIPSELGSLDRLWYLFLSRNQLSGEIPPELGNLTGLGTLLLSANQLSGAIPSELGNLVNLDLLALSNNMLSGCIPEALETVPSNDFDNLGLPFCE